MPGSRQLKSSYRFCVHYNMQKNTARREVRRRCRNNAFTKESVRNALQEVQRFAGGADAILAYVPVGATEVPFVFALMKRCPHQQFFFPRVMENEMGFYRASVRNDFASGAFGIPEPSGNDVFVLKEHTNVLVLVPALAMDKSGNRLGRGGGFYDRFLSEFLTDAKNSRKKVTTLAVVPQCALLAQVPHTALDVPIEHVIVV